MFGETFLAKRYTAGREDGREEGREEMRAGRDAAWRADLSRLLAEDPETVAERLQELLGNGDAPLNGKGRRNGK